MSDFLDDPVPSFNEWLLLKEGKKFSSNWSFYILQKNSGREEDAKQMLLDYFELYVNDLIEIKEK